MSLLKNIKQDNESIFIERVSDWLKERGIKNYGIRDGVIDVVGSVYLWNLRYIPDYIKFGKVDGDFYFTCSTCMDLEGCPQEVTGLFSITGSKYIESLQYAPKKAGKFYASFCKKKFTKEEILEVCEVKDSIVV